MENLKLGQDVSNKRRKARHIGQFLSTHIASSMNAA